MPAQHVVKAAAVLIAMNAITGPLPEVIGETGTAAFVEALSETEEPNGGLNHLASGTNIGCQPH